MNWANNKIEDNFLYYAGICKSTTHILVNIDRPLLKAIILPYIGKKALFITKENEESLMREFFLDTTSKIGFSIDEVDEIDKDIASIKVEQIKVNLLDIIASYLQPYFVKPKVVQTLEEGSDGYYSVPASPPDHIEVLGESDL